MTDDAVGVIPRLGEKALACLRIADERHREYRLESDADMIAGWAAWAAAGFPSKTPKADALYAAACARWSEKAVDRKFERLSDRDYIEYGSSARMGWLTPKGARALAAADAVITLVLDAHDWMLGLIRDARGCGLSTTPGGTAKQARLHALCLDLERDGKIRRHRDEPDWVLWMPVDA